jgi:hypothetical protein
MFQKAWRPQRPPRHTLCVPTPCTLRRVQQCVTDTFSGVLAVVLAEAVAWCREGHRGWGAAYPGASLRLVCRNARDIVDASMQSLGLPALQGVEADAVLRFAARTGAVRHVWLTDDWWQYSDSGIIDRWEVGEYVELEG